MTKSSGDPLLTAARVLIILILVVLAVSLAAVTLGVGALLTVGRDEVWKRIAAADAPDMAFWVVIAAFALIGVAIALALRFFQTLHRIAVSVDRGDAFEIANARRLRAMGWLVAAGQLLMLPLAAMGRWLAPYLERLGEDYRADLGLDPATILMILILFILARVFERGAAMRDDLEGTV